MAESIDRGLARRLREESERSKGSPYPAGTSGTRPNRGRTSITSGTISSRNRVDVRAEQDKEREGDTGDRPQCQQSQPAQPGASNADE